jgi:hypothetical protein
VFVDGDGAVEAEDIQKLLRRNAERANAGKV